MPTPPLTPQPSSPASSTNPTRRRRPKKPRTAQSFRISPTRFPQSRHQPTPSPIPSSKPVPLLGRSLYPCSSWLQPSLSPLRHLRTDRTFPRTIHSLQKRLHSFPRPGNATNATRITPLWHLLQTRQRLTSPTFLPTYLLPSNADSSLEKPSDSFAATLNSSTSPSISIDSATFLTPADIPPPSFKTPLPKKETHLLQTLQPKPPSPSL